MIIPEHIINRKAPRTMAAVHPEALTLLNSGHIATLNLPEWLMIDNRLLITNLLTEAGEIKALDACLTALDKMQKRSVLGSNLNIGFALAQSHADSAIDFLSRHASDSARSYAACAIGQDKRLASFEKIAAVKPFAADLHFGVRELAWLGIRQSISSHLDESIEALIPWSSDRDANVRRFASESTRPRGVWCSHISALKSNPEKAFGILHPLRADESRYVQDSVANWLNDAGKSSPDWLLRVCQLWESESNNASTARIIHRATRSLRKAI